MMGWRHQLNGHEFEQSLGVGAEWGSLVCCGPWGCKELDTTERLNCLRGTVGNAGDEAVTKHAFVKLTFFFFF